MSGAAAALTLRDLVCAIGDRGSAPCIVSVGKEGTVTASAAEVARQALGLARGLVAAGLEPREPVAVIGPSRPEMVTVRLALLAAGAVAAPVDDLASPDEAANMIRDCGARRAFTSRRHLEAVCRTLGTGADIRLLDGDAAMDAPAPDWCSLVAEHGPELPPLTPGDPAVLVYTSGTTGTPKSFTLSHANILHNVEVLARERLIGADDRVLMPLPLHHIYPFVVGTLLVLGSGAAIVLPEAPGGPELLRALAAGGPTAMIGVPAMYAALLHAIEARAGARGRLAARAFGALLRLSLRIRLATGANVGWRLFAPIRRRSAPRLRLMASGGARLEPGVAAGLEGLGFTCFSGYGLAETASIFTGNLPGAQRIGSEGRALPGGEIRIADPGPDGTGEIQLKGPSVFSGYRNDEAANREAFTPDGWFRTGDLGRLDDGYLHVTGRIKEMIVLAGGKNLFPEEIEAHLGRVPGLREVAVLEHRGRLVALALPDPGALAGGPYRRVEDLVRVALAERTAGLPPFKRPAGFAIARAPLPRTRLGKLRRHLLPQLYAAAAAGRPVPAPAATTSPEDAALLREPAVREIRDWLAARYEADDLPLDASPALDLGIDSIEWIELALQLEQRFGTRLGEEDIAGIATVRDLLRTAGRARRGPPPAPREGGNAASLAERHLRPARGWERGFGIAAFALDHLGCRLLFRVEASGLDRLPARPPYVLVANHASDLDPFVLAACLPFRQLRHLWWGGDRARLFRGRMLPAFARALNVFPVEEWAPAASLALAETLLARGEALAWFPESWRSPDGTVQRFLPGIGLIVEQARVPCVPVLIRGTFEAMPRTARWPRPGKVRIRFGDPIPPETLLRTAREGADRHQRISSALRDAVMGLRS